jgi:hypothetical protein
MQHWFAPLPVGTLPGPSRRITVEPIRVPTHTPPTVPAQPPGIPDRPRRDPDRERPPDREPARSC